MSEKNIKPEKITKPIQLLAVWLIGLIIIETSLLTASAMVSEPNWLSALYGISAVAIIPIFLILIFLLQTKFRPQIQEDEYYAKYLDKNTMSFVDVSKNIEKNSELSRDEIKQLIKDTQSTFESVKSGIQKGETKNELEGLISKSDINLDKLEKIVKYSSLDVRINRRIKTFKQIVNSIQKLNIVSFKEFGEKELPQNFLVSFTKTFPATIVKEIILELIPHGASYINLVDDEEAVELNYDKSIFIGSYKYEDLSNVSIDEKMLKKIVNLDDKSNILDLF